MPQKKKGISQCMIVRNEEENIRKALSWGTDFLLERIVVDTGSSDRTAEIAREMGATVLSFPWNDDFAAAKNYAIEKASGEWIAFLDADEIPVPGDAEKIRIVTENLGDRADAVAVSLLDLDENGRVRAAGTQLRLFRNVPGLRYHRRIHEQLLFEDGRPLRLADAVGKISVLHTGYAGEAAKRKKREGRNLRLLLKEIEDNPGSSELMGYIGDEYRDNGHTDEARRWYEKAIAAMPEDASDVRSAATFSHFMELEIEEENEEKVRELYNNAISRMPAEPDFDYILGRYLASKEMYEEGTACIGRALEKLEKYGNRDRAVILGGDLPQALEIMAFCCQKSGQFEESVRYGRCLLTEEPYKMGVLVAVLRSFFGMYKGDISAAQNFLWEIYGKKGTLKDKLFCIRAIQEIPWSSLEKEIFSWLLPEEAACLRAAGKENK